MTGVTKAAEVPPLWSYPAPVLHPLRAYPRSGATPLRAYELPVRV
ncbi:MAG: hypothetical protein ACRDOD_02360 [Streptosporangiaceae bacterium]